MARAIWKGSISFGLVAIPVELQAAVRDNRPRLHLLHAKDRSPIKYERVCQKEDEEVGWDEIVKGYEYTKGRFVLLTKEDFEAAALEKSHAIDILDFVKTREIDERYFETSYYLVPQRGGERAYALLRDALRDTGRAGIAKLILREDEHLAAITVHERALLLTMMRFADQIVDVSEFDLPAAGQARSKELEIARTLVTSLAARWSPEKYTDQYRANLMRIIDARRKGQEPDLHSPAPHVPAEVVDLMERLRQSLGQAPARQRTAIAADRSRPKARPKRARRSTSTRARKRQAA
jgi:DNA end-binding protein Ku